MILPITKLYIKMETNKDSESISSILVSYSKLTELGDNKLIFTIIPFTTLSDLNGNSSFYKIICISGGWAVRLVLFNDDETRKACLATIGHELGHKEKHFIRMLYFQNFRFLSWIMETYCDFFGANKMLKGSRKDFIKTIEYKMLMKNIKIEDEKEKTPILHPTWEKRLGYATNFDFDDNLIDQIKIDTKCKNFYLVQSVKEFYKEKHIILK